MTGQLLAAATNEMSTGESTLFVVLGLASLAGAVGMVLARNAVHSALFLVLTMLSLGVFYFIQQGPFLGAVQIIVYTGAIMILFLFVLMLVGRDAADSVVETLRGQRVLAVLFGLGFAALVGAAVYRGARDIQVAGIRNVNSSVSDIAAKLFHDYVFAFELTSALLITAAVGAMVLAHVERPRGLRASQKDLARTRFQGERQSPLPGPGVFATSDSIATPALLPDGTVAPGSVSHLVEPNLTGANLTGANMTAAAVPAAVGGAEDTGSSDLGGSDSSSGSQS